MKFLYNTFKAKKKQIVKVTFDKPTKVKLMTAFDLQRYKQGRTHRYRGGFFEESPVYFRLPSDGIWNAVVEKGSPSNELQIQASVNILPPDKKTKESKALDVPPNGTRSENNKPETESAQLQPASSIEDEDGEQVDEGAEESEDRVD